MITTADLIDICLLYYIQAAMRYERITFRSVESGRKYSFHCSMYALSARLILEGAY